jgi:hypothetical protein
MTLDEQVQQLKDRHATAVRTRARAEHERDTAEHRVTELTQQLRHEFGVSSVDEAKGLLATLNIQLVTAVTNATHALDQAEQGEQ